jgi:nitroreductase
MDVEQAIRTKHAVRRFSDQPVPDDVIRQILDAGRRSQSSKNTQPQVYSQSDTFHEVPR